MIGCEKNLLLVIRKTLPLYIHITAYISKQNHERIDTTELQFTRNYSPLLYTTIHLSIPSFTTRIIILTFDPSLHGSLKRFSSRLIRVYKVGVYIYI
jgi:hypothetical protein